MKKIFLSSTIFFFLLLTIRANGYAQSYDFGDGTSKTLAVKGWYCINTKDYESAIVYADKCTSSFSEKAIEQQKSLSDFPPKDETKSYWALNDVATCLFIKGKALKELGRTDEAKKTFQHIADIYGFAQCWDDGENGDGFYWKVAEGAKDQIVMMEKGVDFLNYTSEKITTQAWKSYEEQAYEKCHIYADRCISIYQNVAKEQQSSLTDFAPEKKEFDYWALNDVATCWFIKGLAFVKENKNDDAKKAFETVINDFSYAQCWDPRGWFWKQAQGAKDQIIMMETGVDFGDNTSSTLTTKAWLAFIDSKWKEMDIYADKCISMYEKEAVKQQSKISDFPPMDKRAFNNWALNDVATCYFIKGKALLTQGKNDDAKKILQKVIKKFPHALCWDPKGWFWKPAQGAKDQIFMMETGIDFGDGSSATLTGKAWEALNQKDFKNTAIFAQKCIDSFEKDAKKQQASLQTFASKDDAHKYWALNDVAISYFILGNMYTEQKNYQKAYFAYKKILDYFSFAQCWDPQGWFWKVSLGAQKEMAKLSALQSEGIKMKK
jgi:tetratricopeptide (TPR) repeat protein